MKLKWQGLGIREKKLRGEKDMPQHETALTHRLGLSLGPAEVNFPKKINERIFLDESELGVDVSGQILRYLALEYVGDERKRRIERNAKFLQWKRVMPNGTKTRSVIELIVGKTNRENEFSGLLGGLWLHSNDVLVIHLQIHKLDELMLRVRNWVIASCAC